MKKLLLIALLGCSTLGFSQFVRIDGGVGYATTFGKFRTHGLNISTEPKFFFNENISVGLRLETNVLFGGKISTSEPEDINVGYGARTAVLLKGEYYFGQGNTKPFAGLMGGFYNNASVSLGTAGVGASVYRSGGIAPEFGVSFGGKFRMSAMYHYVFGKDDVSVTLSTGMSETVSIGRGYFVFSLGFRVWGTGIMNLKGTSVPFFMDKLRTFTDNTTIRRHAQDNLNKILIHLCEVHYKVLSLKPGSTENFSFHI